MASPRGVASSLDAEQEDSQLSLRLREVRREADVVNSKYREEVSKYNFLEDEQTARLQKAASIIRRSRCSGQYGGKLLRQIQSPTAP